MGMYDSIDRLVNMCDEVIESDPPGLRQKVVARYMTVFGEIIERETGTRVMGNTSPDMIDITSVETIRELLLAHRDRMEYDYMMAKATARPDRGEGDRHRRGDRHGRLQPDDQADIEQSGPVARGPRRREARPRRPAVRRRGEG